MGFFDLLDYAVGAVMVVVVALVLIGGSEDVKYWIRNEIRERQKARPSSNAKMQVPAMVLLALIGLGAIYLLLLSGCPGRSPHLY